MNGDPRPGRLGELVVHVVGLVQEELQHQPVVRTGQCHFPHTNLDRRSQLGVLSVSQYFWAQAGVESEAVSILGMREGIPVPVLEIYFTEQLSILYRTDVFTLGPYSLIL